MIHIYVYTSLYYVMGWPRLKCGQPTLGNTTDIPVPYNFHFIPKISNRVVFWSLYCFIIWIIGLMFPK